MNEASRVIALVLLLSLASVARAQSKETVTVDLSADRGPVTYRASGFLHGENSTMPGSSLVSPLKPRLFRGDDTDDMMNAENYARASGQGAASMYILGDAWIDNQYGFNPSNARIVTAGTMSAWNSFVAKAVSTAIASGQTFQWDVWNEPNQTEFWTGGEAEYQAMWLNAVKTIRGIDPNQVIVGPSTDGLEYLTDLLGFAKKRKVLPDIVAFHELSGVPDLVSDVAEVKGYLHAHDRSITLIDVSEITGYGETYLPGTTVRYLAAIERAQLNAAARGCWNGDCFDNSLDGLLRPDGTTRRALWWAYEGYAEITGRLVNVKPSASVDGIAGQDPALNQAYSVFGRESSPVPRDIQFIFNHISSAGYLNAGGGVVHVVAYRLANDGGSGSSGLVQILDADYTVAADEIAVTIPSLGGDEVCTIHLTSGAGPSSNNPAAAIH